MKDENKDAALEQDSNQRTSNGALSAPVPDRNSDPDSLNSKLDQLMEELASEAGELAKLLAQGPEYDYAAAKKAVEPVDVRTADDWTTIGLKVGWSVIIATILAFQIRFQFVFMYQIGKGLLDFREYEWFVQIVLGANFASIVSLVTAILSYIFSKDSRPTVAKKAE